jgi:hypothetical protein
LGRVAIEVLFAKAVAPIFFFTLKHASLVHTKSNFEPGFLLGCVIALSLYSLLTEDALEALRIDNEWRGRTFKVS